MLVKVLAVVEWLILLKGSDAFYSGYLLLGGTTVAVLINRSRADIDAKRQWILRAMAMLFSAAVALSNYRLMVSGLYWGISLYAGYVVGRVTLDQIYTYLTRTVVHPHDGCGGWRVFAAAFFVILGVNLAYFLTKGYPGFLSTDSIWQIEQILTGTYSNHHPYWHTQFIGVFIRLGMHLFENINMAVALYCTAQILLMALCFAYALMTMYQAGMGVKYLCIPFAVYALMPYHIIYSCTVWKDVLFGGAMLAAVTALYRMIMNVGRTWRNGIVFAIALMGVALFRNNGWIVLLASFVLWFFFFGKKRMKMAAVFAVVLLVSWIMKNPVLEHLCVEESNFRESLSIPIQQVARVIAKDGHITQEQRQQLENVVNVDSVAQWYTPHISDPVKFNVDGEYIREHKMEFLKLWADIGIENPVVYLEAYIEQTKGYWNAGYPSWFWFNGITANNCGIEGEEGWVCSFLDLRWPKIFEPLFSIGMHVWAVVVLFAFNCLRGEKEKAYLAVPLIMMIGTLLIATPVYSEFRYAYSLFTVLPVYVLMSLPLEKAQ